MCCIHFDMQHPRQLRPAEIVRPVITICLERLGKICVSFLTGPSNPNLDAEDRDELDLTGALFAKLQCGKAS